MPNANSRGEYRVLTDPTLRKRQLRKLKQAPVCTECGRRASAADLLDSKQYWDALSTGARQLAVAEGPETLIVSTADRRTGRSVFIKGSVNTASIENAVALAGISASTGTIVDVGAGYGARSIAAVSRGIFTRAVAIEPSPQMFRLLQANVALNGLVDSVSCVEAALAPSAETEIAVSEPPKNPADARVVSPDTAGSVVPAVTTLDEVAPGLTSESDLIVLDVAGYEGAVLSGASTAISTGTPVLFRFSPSLTSRYDCFAGIQSLLAHHGGWYDLGVAEPERQSGGYLSDIYRSTVEAQATASIEVLVTAS